jgi:DNA/RNA endonuclease YhcR with UshA esterase domain/sporulation protein YlmC with PRC-barrel domain
LLKIDPEQLKDAPGFEKGTLPNTTDPLFHQEIYSFYNARPYARQQQKNALAEAQATQEHAGEQSDWGNWDWDSWVGGGDDTTWARRLSELIGTNIENAQGDTIAELEDVIVDSREARAGYAVVSFGGTLGFFADTAIIPWNALRLNLEREAYVTDATLAQFEQAKLSDTEYRNLEDRQYSEALYGTFGTTPFWEEFGYEAGRNQTARTADAKVRSDDAANKAQAKADDANAKADTAAKEQNSNTVTGTVVSVSNYPGAATEAESQGGVRVRVRTESGTVRTVHFATSEEQAQQDLTLNRGDDVIFTGETRDYRGHKVLFASEVQQNGKATTFLK